MKTKTKFTKKQNVLSVINKTINWELVASLAIVIGVFLIVFGMLYFTTQFEVWLESCGFSTKAATSISLLVACMPLLMFILGAAIVNVMRYLSTCLKITALPLTQEEFNDATKNMSLLECLQFFENFISYKMFGITFFYKGFENGNSSEELILLLCLIYNKYKDVDNEKIKESEVPKILKPFYFGGEYHTADEFAARYGIIATDCTEDCRDIVRISTLVKSLCVE